MVHYILNMVPKTGIEPVREDKSRRILSPVRLPVPPLRLKSFFVGGDIQIRTGDQGVAVHCLTAWLCRRKSDLSAIRTRDTLIKSQVLYRLS